MHLFDTTDPGVIAARPRFYITIFVLSLGTYAVAGLAYWLVRNRKQDGPDGPKVKEPPKPSNSKNSATSQPVFNSNGKEATSSTSKITTDATRSLWGQLAPLRWRKNHSAQKTTENIPV
jgi:cytoskeletal protein RodZ